MGIRHHTKRIAAWIACFAILLASFTPMMSHALTMQPTSSTAWTEICTATGLKIVSLSDHGAPSPSNEGQGSHAMHLEDCPYCRVQTDFSGLPPPAEFGFFALHQLQSAPILFYQAPRPLFIWSNAQSRAPPASL